MKHKSISDIVDTLSKEEKRQFKDLIEECLTREQEYKERTKQNKENIELLSKNMEKIFHGLAECNELSSKIRLMLETPKGDLH